MATSKIFNGKKYLFANGEKTKQAADWWAKYHRKQGYLVRVIKESGRYHVYTKPR
ncbi:unnamed protein product [marine sediment metagenome]|uniref:Uncharacterized protein n=1 Tax=marine sediment metagenome TaxID=412755 RepID=X1GHF4_9ZZZZ